MVEDLSQYPEVRKWLTGKAQSTQRVYLSGLRAFVEYTHLIPSSLIDEAERDRAQTVRHRGTPEQKVMQFHDWLRTQYVQKKRGADRGKRSERKVGVSKKLASTYCRAVASFYKSSGYRLGDEGAEFRLPKATSKRANTKLQLRSNDIEQMLKVATRLRDKTIILVMYQGFQSVSEVCLLNYGDVKDQLDQGRDILTIRMVREKSGTEYHFCLGDEAIDLLKLYLEERTRTGDQLTYDSPLFVKEGKYKAHHSRITRSIIEAALRDIAVRSNVVSRDRMKRADMNPARPHALRSSGMTVAKLAGMAEIAVEYMSGHAISETDKAYWEASPTELAQLYQKHYHELRVLKPKFDEQKVRTLEKNVSTLQTDGAKRLGVIEYLERNGKDKDTKILALTKEVDQLKQRVSSHDEVAKQMLNLKLDMELRKKEELVKYVIATAPTDQELKTFMQRRHIERHLLTDQDMQCVSKDGDRWLYHSDLDTYRYGIEV
jgi:site-specific recombinase XerD